MLYWHGGPKKRLQSLNIEAVQLMPETKRTIAALGQNLNVADVPIVSSSESFNTYTLEDGSVLKVKNVATSIARVEGQFMPDGRPVYMVFSTPVVIVEKHTITASK
jgi:hypothetical protein